MDKRPPFSVDPDVALFGPNKIPFPMVRHIIPRGVINCKLTDSYSTWLRELCILTEMTPFGVL